MRIAQGIIGVPIFNNEFGVRIRFVRFRILVLRPRNYRNGIKDPFRITARIVGNLQPYRPPIILSFYRIGKYGSVFPPIPFRPTERSRYVVWVQKFE